MVDKNIEQELRRYRNAVAHGLASEAKWSQTDRDSFITYMWSKIPQHETLRSELAQIKNEHVKIIWMYNIYERTREENKKQEIIGCKGEPEDLRINEKHLILLKAKGNKAKQKKAEQTQVFQNLIIVLPEEYVADLKDLYQQLIKEKRSTWVIRTIILWSVLELLWAFYIQIKIENIWLPKNKARKKIDD